MRFESFIALRYLFARKGHAFISVISWISVAGVALGVASLIVVMGVMNGFTTDLRDKLIGMSSHAVVYSSAGGLTEDRELLKRLNAAPGIVGATPFIQSGVLISSYSGGTGVYLRGVDPDTAGTVLDGLRKLTSGSLEDLKNTDGLPGIIIGEGLASKLAVHIGSRVNLMSPSGQQGAAGFTPRIMPFRVVGLFSVGLGDYDTGLAVVNLDTAREVLGWQGKRIYGIEVAVSDVYRVESIMQAALREVGDGSLYANTWMQMNANLYAALKLEKAAMAVILTLVILVGSFSIITALVMLVMEKTRDVAIMMSMGATTGMVRKIFMLQGTIIGLMGTALGFALGLATCFLLKRYKFIELPRGVYSLDYLPVLLQWPDLALTGACAMLLCFLATLYPAGQAARLEPADALRHE
ncbi:MAG: lipoprotein-releasing ABC transporter permease subunit [Desulfovibrionaceae bacterium]|nr:lipoprotein-releasing ABC transporter permease subunit [Desulfovibrionaceae bacterium]